MSTANESYLVVLDVPGIKEFVFGTDRLVEIRGASGLLDRLNRVDTPALFEERLGEDRVDCIFSAGGAGQFVVQAESSELRETLAALEGLYEKASAGALRVVNGVARLDPSDYKASLVQAFTELNRKRDEAPFSSRTLLHTGYLRECDSCSRPASLQVERFGETVLLCATCAAKTENGRTRGLWEAFAEHLAGMGWTREQALEARPRDFEEIGEGCKARRGTIAMVYADGNAMGRVIKGIADREQFRFFSETVDGCLQEACHEALAYQFPGAAGGRLPCDILLLGGDDLLVCVAADAALPFAVDVAYRFTEKTREAFAGKAGFSGGIGEKGLTLSLGVAYGKSHTPFPLLFHQAEELLASAKSAGACDPEATDSYVPPYIDYHLTSSYNRVDVADCRRTHLEVQASESSSMLRLFMKPYALAEAGELLGHARRMVEERFPRTRLARLGQMPSLGRVNATLECLRLFTRVKENQRRALWEVLDRFHCGGPSMPWTEESQGNGRTVRQTMLGDLIELTRFIAQ